MKGVQVFIAMLGRMALSLIFILAAVGKIMDFQGTQQMISGALANWQTWGATIPWIVTLTGQLMPHVFSLTLLAIIFELLGGALVFFGFRARFGAFLLILFLIPATLFFHFFWNLHGADRQMQMIMFMKNLSILGGLLLVLAFGSGCCKGREASSSKDT